MRLALFSDIHGNLAGLQAVLAAIAAAGGADVIVAAGDLITGESATDEILDLLITHNVRMVRGDADTEDKLLDYQQQARTAPGSTRDSLDYYVALQRWLHTHLSPAGRALLAALPVSHTIEVAPGRRVYVCHASPRSVADRVCAPNCDSATIRAAYVGVDADVIAFGHSHTPYTRLLDRRLYVNVASVGFRPDGMSMLTFITYDDDRWLVQQQAIPYDVAAEDARKRQRRVPIPGA
jgi:predicted phosphodiesterase